MTLALARVAHPDELPPAWDALAESLFQRRAFLRHAHAYNPCRQRYYLLTEGGALVAGAVVYRLRLDLLTFLKLPSPLGMQVVGIPCSVSTSGVLGALSRHGELLARLPGEERGLLIALNLSAIPPTAMAVGRTLPTIEVENRWATWEAYVAALRAPYRRRLRRQAAHAATLTIETGPCARFTDAMHALYLQTFQRSHDKLERLTADFFRQLPAEFQLTTYADAAGLHGWTISVLDGERWTFFLGGRSYAASAPPDLYFQMLLTVLRQGIAAGARIIDLGQTAETPKLRLGGVPRERFLLGHHSNPLLCRLLHWGRGALSYGKTLERPLVWREYDH
jgi:hypothetical protein